MRYFLAVAEELHFGRAARRLGISQPPLSQQIQRLEGLLGAPLFSRDRRHVSLTAAGLAFREGARRAIAEAGRTARAALEASQGRIGSLRVGFSASAAFSLLPEALRLYRASFPEVCLSLHESLTADQLDALARGELDVAILRGPLGKSGLRVETVHREPFVAALPRRHPKGRSPRVRLASLADEPFVLFPREAAPGFHDSLIGLMRSVGFSPRVVQEAAEWHTIVSLVAGGLGVSIVPASLRNLGRSGVSYRQLLPGGEAQLAMACRPEQSPLVKRFADALRAAGAAARA